MSYGDYLSTGWGAAYVLIAERAAPRRDVTGCATIGASHEGGRDGSQFHLPGYAYERIRIVNLVQSWMGKAGRDSSLTIEDVPKALAPPGQQG